LEQLRRRALQVQRNKKEAAPTKVYHFLLRRKQEADLESIPLDPMEDQLYLLLYSKTAKSRKNVDVHGNC